MLPACDEPPTGSAAPTGANPAAASAYAGRHGPYLRFVIGAAEPPPIELGWPAPPDASRDPAVALDWRAPGFRLLESGREIVRGTADPAGFRLAIDVGAAEILGFGAANGRPNRNDSRFRVMAIDTLMYAIPGASYTAVPFFIARHGAECRGFLFVTSLPLDVVVGHGRVEVAAACDAGGSPIDILVLRGHLADVVRAVASVVGRSFLPPAWALGFHQSRWSYRNARAVLDVARRLRKHDLPADAVHLDIHYMDRYRVFTFHPRRFPRPARLHADLAQLGLRSLAIVDPGVSVADYHAYRTLRNGRLLLGRADGSPYVGRVWPGATVFPDFSREEARRAWAELHAPLIDAGVAGFWNDMNDPVLRAGEYYDPLREGVWHAQGVPHGRARNLYANGMAAATYAALQQARPGQRPFVLSRSGFPGIQRHAAIWTGDNHSTWSHLRENLDMVLNLGLSGVPLAGADVGGFARGPGRLGIFKPRRPSAELFVRWMELGALMPFFRVHCTLFAPSQDPWSFGRTALAACRRVLRRRYRLLPLFYRLALEAHEEGLPIVRPVRMHCDVPEGAGDGQFLLGRDVLVAPVLESGVRNASAYLPAGDDWVDWHDGRVHAGGRSVTVPAPLGRTPMFVRSGAALFVAEPHRNAAETLAAPLALDLHPSPTAAAGRGSLFLDDGESASGARFVLDAEVDYGAEDVQVRFVQRQASFAPTQARFEVRVPAGRYGAAVVDGERVALTRRVLAEEDRTSVVDVASVAIDARWLQFES
jgi:alpha-glucosidase